MPASRRTEGRVLWLACVAALLSVTVAEPCDQRDGSHFNGILGGCVSIPINSTLEIIDAELSELRSNGWFRVVVVINNNNSNTSNYGQTKYALKTASFHIQNLTANDSGKYELIVAVAYNGSTQILYTCFKINVSESASPPDDGACLEDAPSSLMMQPVIISTAVASCVLAIVVGVIIYKCRSRRRKITKQVFQAKTNSPYEHAQPEGAVVGVDVNLVLYSTVGKASTVQNIQIKEIYSEVFQAKTNSPYENAQTEGAVVGVDVNPVLYSTVGKASTVQNIQIKEMYSEVFQAKTNSPSEYAQIEGGKIRGVPSVNRAGAASRAGGQDPLYDEILPTSDASSTAIAVESPYSEAFDSVARVRDEGTSQF